MRSNYRLNVVKALLLRQLLCAQGFKGRIVEQGVDVERVEESKLTLEDIYTTIIKEDEER